MLLADQPEKPALNRRQRWQIGDLLAGTCLRNVNKSTHVSACVHHILQQPAMATRLVDGASSTLKTSHHCSVKLTYSMTLAELQPSIRMLSVTVLNVMDSSLYLKIDDEVPLNRSKIHYA